MAIENTIEMVLRVCLAIAGGGAATFFSATVLAASEQSYFQVGPSLYPELLVYPRHAGKPDPRWRDFDWKYTERTSDGVDFRLHFYNEELWAARFTLPLIMRQVRELKKSFGFSPSQRFDYVLFTSLEGFREANIFFVQEGVRGITSTQEASMALPYVGDPEDFAHVSKHELTHQFQTQAARSRAGDVANRVLERIPLWFIEGMAEYESLGGLDIESRAYLRDILLHPNSKEKYEMPDFFDQGVPSFVFLYKVGQAKVDFLERAFGKGASHRVFEAMIEARGGLLFESAVERVTGRSKADLEKLWREDLRDAFEGELENFSQPAEDFEEVGGVGENLDFFAISPAGETLALREVDPLSGVTYIRLMSASGGKKSEVVRDAREETIGLYFLQAPTLTLSDRLVAYFVQTLEGPQLELRSYRKNGDQFELESARRLPQTTKGLLRATSPALSADDRSLAFVGLTPDGQQALYVADLENGGAPQEILREPYTWRSLAWLPRSEGRPSRLIGSSNRSAPDLFNIYAVDPTSGSVERLTTSMSDQLAVEVSPSGEWVFQSFTSGASQIHLATPWRETRLTGIQTMAIEPSLREEALYFLGFKSGRYRLYRLPREKFVNEDVPRKKRITAEAWVPELADIDLASVNEYRPFRTAGIRLDELGGFIGGGGVTGIVANASDLMRNYQINATVLSPDNPDYSVAQVRFASQKGRATWAVGAFRVVQPRLDNVFLNDETRRFYRHTEWGLLGSWEYPLTIFSSFGVGGRVASVKRNEYSDLQLREQWEAQVRDSDFVISPSIWYGYDRVLYEPVTGPIRGFSILLETGSSYYTGAGVGNPRTRLDLASYWQLFNSRTVLALEGIAGATFGDMFRDPFFIWSDDILRAYPPGDRRLLGNFIAAAKAELRFPLGSWFNFPNLRGLAAFDYGTVAREWDQAEQNRASSASIGASISLPPLSLELVESWTLRTAAGEAVGSDVLHFRLQYLYQ